MTTEEVASEIVVEAPRQRVLDVLCDFESYPDWARSMSHAKVLERDEEGRASTVEFRVAPVLLPQMRYVLSYSYTDGGLAWSYVEGDLKDIHGSYVLEEVGGRTKVTYNLGIDPGKLRLPGFVKARAAREITRVALKELKRRIENP